MMKKHIVLNKIMAGFLAGTLMLACSACGQSSDVQEESIELLEPVGVAVNYEIAERRTLYDTKVYAAYVCPYTEEYELPVGQSFVDFDALPGQDVKPGDKLLHSSTENIDKQIEQRLDEITAMDERQHEFLTENREALLEPTYNKAKYEETLAQMKQTEPPKTITVLNPATNTNEEVDNPDYAQWEMHYNKVDAEYRSAIITVDKLTASRDQTTELYELDRAYKMKQIQYLKNDLKYNVLSSGMNGTVTAIKFLNNGDWMQAETPLVAVSDLNRKELKCDYIAKGTILKAQEVYALIDGKRYEVEYQSMENEEYKRQQEKNDKVYSTFLFSGDVPEIENGKFASIVVVNSITEDALCVPKEAIIREGGEDYVYIVNDSAVYTEVETGISDGVYTQILSGVSDHDKVLCESGVKTGTKTVTLSKGSVSAKFSGSGYLYYPSSELVVNPVKMGTCYIVENKVSLYQQVNKGDVLATIKVSVDQLSLERLNKQLQREQERLDAYRANKDVAEKDKVKTIENMEKSIKSLQESIGDIKSNGSVKTIKSPISGIVTAKNDYEPEALIQNGANMFLVADEAKSYLFVGDENGQLVYGTEVDISFKDGSGAQKTISGKVVSVNQTSVGKALAGDNRMRITWNSQMSGALVMVNPEDLGYLASSAADDYGFWSRTSYSVSAKIRNVENVVLVPKKAVKEVAGTTYVRVKQPDGSVLNQSFVAGGADSSYYWVVSGLTEGMEICLE